MWDRLRSREGNGWRWIAGVVVTAFVVWWLARDMDWPAVWSALQSADYRWVALGVAAIVMTAWTRAWRWQALLRPAEVRLWPVLTALLVGQVTSLVLPAPGSYVARAVLIGPEQGTGASEALGSVLLEKVWDLLALLLCGLLLLALMPLPGWFARSTWGTALTLAAGIPLLWAALHWQEEIFRGLGRLLTFLPGGWKRAFLPRLQRLAGGLNPARQTDVSVWVLVWTLATWGLGALANWAVLAAFGFHSLAAALFLLAALMVGSSAVPTPGRLGVFEGICVVALAWFDVPVDRALALGLVLHLVVMGPPLPLAALLTLRQAWGQRGEYAKS